MAFCFDPAAAYGRIEPTAAAPPPPQKRARSPSPPASPASPPRSRPSTPDALDVLPEGMRGLAMLLGGADVAVGKRRVIEETRTQTQPALPTLPTLPALPALPTPYTAHTAHTALPPVMLAPVEADELLGGFVEPLDPHAGVLREEGGLRGWMATRARRRTHSDTTARALR